MAEVLIRLDVEPLPEGVFVFTSPDVPGLVAQADTIAQGIELCQRLSRRLLESYIENGEPVPPALLNLIEDPKPFQLAVPVGVG